MATDPVQQLIDAGAIPTTPFGPNSRYAGVPLARYRATPADPGVPYVRRRFLPRLQDIAVAVEHVVHGGDRIDNLAAQYFGDAELYWRIADANAVSDPAMLTDTVGERIVVPQPPGAAGA